MKNYLVFLKFLWEYNIMKVIEHKTDLLDSIKKLKSIYQENKVIFIDGKRVSELLKMLGASENDIEKLRFVSDNLKKDPTLNFRESRSGRFVFDFKRNSIYRTEFQPFILSKQEDFVRHDSGKIRHFYGISESLSDNSAFQALLKLKHLLIQNISFSPRPHLDYKSKDWVTTVFHLRTITDSQTVGEPALEGVHSDGVDHTMTVLFGHNNMGINSAISYIHSMEQKTSISTKEADPSHILGQFQHWDFLDTLLIVDHERKHSLTAVERLDERHNATRDMLILFTRKPTLMTHISYQFDSKEAHPDYPVEFLAYHQGKLLESI